MLGLTDGSSTFIHYIVSLLLYSKLETILAYYFNNIPDAPDAPDAQLLLEEIRFSLGYGYLIWE